MVKAILEGRKTQTRRVVKFKNTFFQGVTGQAQAHHEFKSCYPAPGGGFVFWNTVVGKDFSDRGCEENEVGYRCPYGEAGDRLWVRETWRAEEVGPYGVDGIRFRADDAFRKIENTREASELWGDAHRPGDPWRPSIFMPRWASRITLEIVDTRAERLQDIIEDDARAEGIVWRRDNEGRVETRDTRPIFADLWDSINRSRGFGWSVDPWVWIVEFKRAEQTV